MKVHQLIFLIAVCLLVSIAATLSYYSFYVVESVQTIDAHVIIDTYVGINVDTDKLYFGTVNPGGEANRWITIGKNIEEPLRVRIKTSGQMKQWIIPNETSFVMTERTKDIQFTLYPPDTAEKGEYTGKVKFYFLKP